MQSRKYIIIGLVAVILTASGVFVWDRYSRQAEAARTEAEILKRLTVEDLKMVVKSQMGAGDASSSILAESADARKAFIRGLQEHLALAAQARREGLTNDPLFQANYEYKKRILFSEMYQSKLGHSAKNPLIVSDDELSAVFTPANEKAFNRDMETMNKLQQAVAQTTGSGIAPGVLQGESLDRAKKKWARVRLLSDKALMDGEFIGSPTTQLRSRILEAGLLSSDLLRRHWPDRIRANEAEMAEFIASDPKYDLSKKKALAQQIYDRVSNGERIEKLAAEFSEHRPTKEQGGLLKDISFGSLPAELEKEILAIEPGTLARNVIETEMGWFVARLEGKDLKKDGNGSTSGTYTVRMILIQNKFEQPSANVPGIPPPFLSADEIARYEIEQRKRAAYIAEVMAANPIEMPEDFEVPVR